MGFPSLLNHLILQQIISFFIIELKSSFFLLMQYHNLGTIRHPVISVLHNNTMTWLAVTGYLCHKVSSHNPVNCSFMTYQRVSNKGNTLGSSRDTPTPLEYQCSAPVAYCVCFVLSFFVCFCFKIFASFWFLCFCLCLLGEGGSCCSIVCLFRSVL
jgi:hypothetical protein